MDNSRTANRPGKLLKKRFSSGSDKQACFLHVLNKCLQSLQLTPSMHVRQRLCSSYSTEFQLSDALPNGCPPKKRHASNVASCPSRVLWNNPSVPDSPGPLPCMSHLIAKSANSSSHSALGSQHNLWSSVEARHQVGRWLHR